MELSLIEKKEFDRILESSIPKYDKLSLFANMCRYNTLVSIKKAGSGHMGSSFSAMDIVTYLYLNELNTLKTGLDSPGRDIYFSSKGHDVPGLYSLFYALGIVSEEEILKLRRLGGLDGHPEVRINGIEANSGSLGMGIAKGKGMAWAKKYKGEGGRVFVLTGDGEFQEGQIFESLQITAHQKITNLTVIIDRNKFQTDMLVDDVNSIENLYQKVTSFGWYVTRMNGHDFREIERVFEEIKHEGDKPKFIIADTIKGRGLSFMEQGYKDETGRTFYKWHSGAPDDEHFEKGISEFRAKFNEITSKYLLENITYKTIVTEPKQNGTATKEYVTEAYGNALCEIAKTRKDMIVLDGDLSADCKLRKFERMYPDRFIENGIAEQDMVSTAGGLARTGLLPVVNSFASFLASRANEQIYNNACENTKIIYTCHFAGLIPAGPGKSHQSVRDISLFGAIPNVTIVQPCNSEETTMALDYCVNDSRENCVLRLIIGPSPRKIELPEDYMLEFGKGSILKEGDDAVIFAYGPVMLHEALTASELLASDGFGLRVVNMPWLNRADNNWLMQAIGKCERVFVLEDHSVYGGLGSYILQVLAEQNSLDGLEISILGLDEYPECGTPFEVLQYHRLDGKSLARRIAGDDAGTKGSTIEHAYSEEAPQ